MNLIIENGKIIGNVTIVNGKIIKLVIENVKIGDRNVKFD
jgi:hypothetical protein